MKRLMHGLYWRIDAYLTGEVRPAAAEVALRAHLKACAECRAYYERGLALMRAARGSTSKPAVGELERLTRRAGQLAVAPRHELKRPMFALAAAAIAMLLVVVLLPRRPVVGVVGAVDKRTTLGERLAEAGDEVREGDVVAAVEGSAVVQLEGGRDVTLAEGAAMTAQESGAAVSLESGSARFLVEPGVGRFAVRAGATRVEVKGTVFTVTRQGPTDVTVAVERGRVEVAGTKSAVTLEAGQRTSVGRGGVPDAPSALRQGDSDELRRLGEELERGHKIFKDKMRKIFR